MHSKNRNGDHDMVFFFNLRVTFDKMINRNKVLLDNSNFIETHIDVVIESLEVQSSVAFEFYIDEEFI